MIRPRRVDPRGGLRLQAGLVGETPDVHRPAGHHDGALLHLRDLFGGEGVEEILEVVAIRLVLEIRIIRVGEEPRGAGDLDLVPPVRVFAGRVARE